MKDYLPFLVGFGVVWIGTITSYVLRWHSKRHRCAGEEVDRYFTPPSNRAVEAQGHAMLGIMEDAFYGYTLITYRCECGNDWTKKLLGKAA